MRFKLVLLSSGSWATYNVRDSGQCRPVQPGPGAGLKICRHGVKNWQLSFPLGSQENLGRGTRNTEAVMKCGNDTISQCLLSNNEHYSYRLPVCSGICSSDWLDNNNNNQWQTIFGDWKMQHAAGETRNAAFLQSLGHYYLYFQFLCWHRAQDHLRLTTQNVLLPDEWKSSVI